MVRANHLNRHPPEHIPMSQTRPDREGGQVERHAQPLGLRQRRLEMASTCLCYPNVLRSGETIEGSGVRPMSEHALSETGGSVLGCRIADGLRQIAGAQPDVIVLAQATMAGAVDRCSDLPVPVLASPRLGLADALAQWRAGG